MRQKYIERKSMLVPARRKLEEGRDSPSSQDVNLEINQSNNLIPGASNSSWQFSNSELDFNIC